MYRILVMANDAETTMFKHGEGLQIAEIVRALATNPDLQLISVRNEYTMREQVMIRRLTSREWRFPYPHFTKDVAFANWLLGVEQPTPGLKPSRAAQETSWTPYGLLAASSAS